VSRADLPDLAALEWAHAEVFEEADAVVSTHPTGLDQPLQIIPALRMFEVAHDVLSVWQALEDSLPAPELVHEDLTIVVWRKAFTVYHVRLLTAEAQAFKLAISGASMAEICAAFAEEPEPLETAMRAIGSWFAEGWIVDTTQMRLP
jgi:hypothetical protein